MAAPFSGEDLVKRSIFSAVFNVGGPNKQQQKQTALPPPPSRNQWLDFDETQPCSTNQLRTHDAEYSQTLSEKLEDTLLLASPPFSTASPNDIFQEILTECTPLEHTQWFPQQHPDPLVCPSCLKAVTLIPLSAALAARESQTEQQKFPSHHLRNLLSSGSLSIEELVKSIISTVRDDGLRSQPGTPMSNESSEEILRRKRQQNNEAAARYRQRQKHAKLTKNDEVTLLAERNQELRRQVSDMQREMRLLRDILRERGG